MINASIGKRIRKAREKRKMTQEAFAEKIGISETYVGMIERGERMPKLDIFIKMANILEVSADYLLADLTDTGFEVKTTILSEKIGKLPREEQEHIYEVIELLIKQTHK